MNSWAYLPLNEQECTEAKSFVLLDDGIYDFQVVIAEAQTSKAGNPMIKLQLEIYDKQGCPHIIFDYLLSTKNMMWKTKHFCDSVGLSKEYEAGTFKPEFCGGRSGKASVITQEGREKPTGGFYPHKNSVEDYVMTNKGALMNKDEKETFTDSDIPF